MKQNLIRWFEVSGYEISKEKTVLTGYAKRYEAEYRANMEVPAVIVFYNNKDGNALLSKFLHRQKRVEEELEDGNIKTWGDALFFTVGTIVSVPDKMVRWME